VTYRLAVKEPAIACDCFQSVADRVAEVQYFSEMAFAFVAFYYIGFDAARARDQVNKLGCDKASQFIHFARDAIKHLSVAYHAVFDGFVEAGLHLARRERAQSLCVNDDERRLMKSADEIFAERVIDPGFSAD
jgi:nitrate/nitrite transporter NarK